MIRLGFRLSVDKYPTMPTLRIYSSRNFRWNR